MFKKLLIVCLAASLYACDDESNDTNKSLKTDSDAPIAGEPEVSDAGLPTQYYDFDTAETDQSPGQDMDD